MGGESEEYYEEVGVMKYRITAHLDLTEDILELDDDLPEEKIEEELWEYVNGFLDWNYQRVE